MFLFTGETSMSSRPPHVLGPAVTRMFICESDCLIYPSMVSMTSCWMFLACTRMLMFEFMRISDLARFSASSGRETSDTLDIAETIADSFASISCDCLSILPMFEPTCPRKFPMISSRSSTRSITRFELASLFRL